METQLDGLGETVPAGQPYGPGKFEGSTDVEAWLWARGLHGCNDDDCGSYSLIKFDEEELAILATIDGYGEDVGAIQYEYESGFVDTDYYSTVKDLDDAWARVVATPNREG